MQAYKIVDWQKMYELTSKGKPANEDTPMEELRKSSFPFIRLGGEGHMLGPAKRRMFKQAWNFGDNVDIKCWGLYISLLDLARDQEREYRGWILDDRQRPINPVQIAEVLGIQEANIDMMFEILISDQVNWVELIDFPEALQSDEVKKQDVNLGNFTGSPQNSPGLVEKGGELRKNEEPFLNVTVTEEEQEQEYETEIETKGKRGELGCEGEPTTVDKSQGAGGREENVQPQAPPAPASVSGSGTVPASVSASERISDSASDSASVPDSVSQPGPGVPGAEGPGHLSKQEIFDIMRQRCQAELEAVQILKLNSRNKSDSTTISDIYSQLAQRLIGGSPYTLFESSLATARQCWRGDKPIAIFVAAMKKPPFYYVPKKLSVIPGKFSQAIIKNRKSQERRTQNE